MHVIDRSFRSYYCALAVCLVRAFVDSNRNRLQKLTEAVTVSFMFSLLKGDKNLKSNVIVLERFETIH